MRRLIHHERGATWDLVEEDGEVWIEHVRTKARTRYTLDEFRETADGKRFAMRVDSILGRTAVIPPAPRPPTAIFWFPRA